MPQLIVICIVAIAGSNGLLWTYMSVKQGVVVQNARFEERRKCETRVAEIEVAGAREKDRAVAEARAAAASIQATPETDMARIALCEKSASCRSRRKP